MAKRRKQRGRAVDGLLILDKPTGISSNQALQRVKRIFGAAKAGHTGSLDPLATGVLPICLGEATKFSQFLLDADKQYFVVAKLGVKTATGDADGEIINTCSAEGVTQQKLMEALQGFRGEIEQVPSMYSALKHEGQPLYKLARQGIEVERKPRTVRIDLLELVRFDGDAFALNVRCSKGTYIRSLVEDIASVLGNYAHVIELRRTAAGPYQEAQAVEFDELSAALERGGHAEVDKLLLSLSTCVDHYPEVSLTENTAYYLCNGQAVQVAGAPVAGWVKLLEADGKFIGVGEILDDGRVAPRRLVSASLR